MRPDDWELRRQVRLTSYQRDAAPLLGALADAGIDTADFGRFVNRPFPGVIEPSRFDRERAVPILLEWLPRIANENVKESAVRHLKATAARSIATQPLIGEFNGASDPAYKWAVAETLCYVADKSQYGELAELAADPRHGSARQMLVGMLWRVKTPRAAEILLSSVDDPDVALQAMSALRRKLGNTAARSHIEPLAGHPDQRVRAAARNHLRKIDRSPAHRES
jgi:HEAT repeat protein